MPLNPRLLRRLFATGAVVVVLIVCAFYLRGILRFKHELGKIPKIPSELTQSTKGFTFSKSEGGRTLFTIHAAQAERYKDNERAELHDVNIVVYGRESNRFDQIYGADFLYDPQSGEVMAKGDVDIDLESDATGASRPDQAPPQETKNPIHLKTSGLVFNHKTGFAETKDRIEFRLPEASGSAVGATYDSRSNLLTLHSDVRIVTTEKQKATITAQNAVITKDPLKAVLHSTHVEQQGRFMQADTVTLLLRNDNSVEKVLADGNLHGEQSGAKGFSVNAAKAELFIGEKDRMRSATVSGGVTFSSRGETPANAKAGRVLLDFGPENQLARARAEKSVELSQSQQGKSMQLKSDALDLLIRNGRTLEKAFTSGAAQVTIAQGQTTTNITADQFEGKFNARNHPSLLTGKSNVKTLSVSPGKADQVTTSREVNARFNDQGTIEEVDQSGDFHYQQGQQTASSNSARYLPADETITLIGSPRIQDGSGSVTAESIQLNRKTNIAVAQREVKTTYVGLKPQPNGGMLGSADPIHVTGDSMVANRNNNTAKFTNARLWQAANIVEAPAITFDRDHRSLQAQAQAPARVKSVFTQVDKNGKAVPVDVTADRLSYVDADRKAVFSGNVVVNASETRLTADSVQVLLEPRGNQPAAAGSQLDRIIALGEIQIEQPNRKATGNQLVYTAQDEKLVLTASAGRRPTITDAEHGQITGDSLTFYRHDDRVLVDSKDSSQTLIQTRIRDASKK
jgi:lipopolysaccharide export system protein LptA